MFDHIGLKVKDLRSSVRFYGAALAPLGHEVAPGDDSCAGVGPKGEAALWLYRSERAGGPGVHVAFRAATRAAVDEFHRAGVANGGRDNGAPGRRPDYGKTYYAAFLIDPDGNNVEAVCMAAA